jgi:L-rhamnose 1-dehydrogenase
MRFQSKAVVVTGGARGIGREIAVRFASEGARVAVVDLDIAGSETVEAIEASGGHAEFLEADVADGAAISAAFEAVLAAWGAIDVLVNNAGICPFESFDDIDETSWRRVIDVNLTGAFLCSKVASSAMIERQTQGSIVMVSSLSSIFASTSQAHYSSSKAGLNLLVRSLAVSLAPHGIRCNAVLPGAIETDLNRSVMSNPETRRHWESRAPLGRLGRTSDVAGPTLFFASDEAALCTGSLLVVDGGTSACL